MGRFVWEHVPTRGNQKMVLDWCWVVRTKISFLFFFFIWIPSQPNTPSLSWIVMVLVAHSHQWFIRKLPKPHHMFIPILFFNLWFFFFLSHYMLQNLLYILKFCSSYHNMHLEYNLKRLTKKKKHFEWCLTTTGLNSFFWKSFF